jgi:DNA-binding winged helix-turn-helix (wHTH) protein/tetratricopeptide (TPR) repeat protein/TolB-like protein
MPGPAFEFNGFRVDLLDRTLWQNGEKIQLGAKEFDVLVVLLENPRTPVSKELLIDRVWGKDAQLAESTLPKHIGALRKKMGKNLGGQDYIRTLTGQGYYLAAEVTTIRQVDSTAPDVAIPTEKPIARDRERRQYRFVVLAATVLGLMALAVWAIAHVPDWIPRRRPSVAILDFLNQSSVRELGWLSRAIAEMLRTELAAGKNIRIIPGEDVARMRSELSLPNADSFSKTTLNGIHRNMDADYVVVGAYTVVGSPAELRLDFKLQDTRSGEVVASEFARGPQASLFDLVSRGGITLRGKLGAGEITASEAAELKDSLPGSLEATRLYALGLDQLRSFNPLAARDLLEKAAIADPRSAVIRSALSEAWATLGYEQRARDDARKAFEMARLLSREKQLLLEARYRELARDWSRTLELYNALWTFFPDNLEYGLRLVHAQVASGHAIDALKTLAQIRRAPGVADDPRIHLAEANATEALGNFQEELDAAERAIQEGKARGNRLLVARAELSACWALDYLGNRKRAKELAQSAASVFADLGDKGGEAQAAKNIADVVDDSGDHAAAIPLYENALVRFKDIGSQTGIAVVLNNTGYALRDSGNLGGAAEHFSASSKLCREMGDQLREAEGLNGLAGVYWRQGKLPLAEATFDQAVLQFDIAGDKNRSATALNNLAIVLQDEGHLVDAQTKLEQSFQRSHETGDQTAMARTSGNLGQLLLRRGELIEAQHKFEQQLSIGNTLVEDKQRAYALCGSGEVLLARGDLAGARAALQESVNLRLKHEEKGLAAESRLSLAEVAAEEKRATAISEARAVAEQFRLEQELDEESVALALLIRTFLNQYPPRIKEAGVEIVRLKEILRNLEDPIARTISSIAIGQFEAASGNQTQALKTLRAAFQQAAEIGYLGQKLEAALLLAELDPNPATRRDSLAKVKQEAESKGFGLIARKAGMTNGR